jgi:hypothetical protein
MGSKHLIGWLRTKKHFGARLALIALALQVLLTFGHVHVRAASVASVVQSSQSNGTAPRDPSHNGLGEFDCPTCALIQLSAISTPPVAPELPLPIATDFVASRPGNMLAATIAPRPSFQARAPPSA